jgi:ribonuclease HII
MISNRHTNNKFECGTDEAGRGCLAGGVVAAAVILPVDFYHPKLNDSKKMSEKSREEVYEFLIKQTQDSGVYWSVAMCDVSIIESINILQASILAMHHAIKNLAVKPDFIIVDGNQFKTYNNIPHECIVKGDGKYASIAAASVLAKVTRDKYMIKMEEKYPGYGFDKHKGYGTKAHYEAIKSLGVTDQHRMSFLSNLSFK